MRLLISEWSSEEGWEVQQLNYRGEMEQESLIRDGYPPHKMENKVCNSPLPYVASWIFSSILLLLFYVYDQLTFSAVGINKIWILHKVALAAFITNLATVTIKIKGRKKEIGGGSPHMTPVFVWITAIACGRIGASLKLLKGKKRP